MALFHFYLCYVYRRDHTAVTIEISSERTRSCAPTKMRGVICGRHTAAWDSHGQKQVQWAWINVCFVFIQLLWSKMKSVLSFRDIYTYAKKIHCNRKKLSLRINVMTVIGFCLFFSLRWHSIKYLFAIKLRGSEIFTQGQKHFKISCAPHRKQHDTGFAQHEDE